MSMPGDTVAGPDEETVGRLGLAAVRWATVPPTPAVPPADDFAGYAQALPPRLNGTGQPLEPAWTLVQAAGGLAGAPPTLTQYRRAGPLSVAQLVDRYPIACLPVRDLLVRYLTERGPAMDYTSLVNLTGKLVGLFWYDLERHHPGISSLRLDPAVATAPSTSTSSTCPTGGPGSPATAAGPT